jgi:peptidyl-prolyl cis-trans isomerase B (cyclophilin B)
VALAVLGVARRAVAALQAAGSFAILFLMWKIIVGIIAAIIILGGGYYFLSGNSSATSPTDTYGYAATSTNSTNAAQTSTTTPTTNTPAKIMHATIHTSMGDIAIEFYPDQAPKAVENFIKLAQSGFYDSTKFHRVIKGFMDQGGDPLTKDDSAAARWGTGGPGYTIADEFGTKYTNAAGTIAMANTGTPNSSGSQFFLNAADNHFLDGKYTVFGKVTSGMDVVTAINNVQTSSDRPLTPVVLKSVTVSQ